MFVWPRQFLCERPKTLFFFIFVCIEERHKTSVTLKNLTQQKWANFFLHLSCEHWRNVWLDCGPGDRIHIAFETIKKCFIKKIVSTTKKEQIIWHQIVRGKWNEWLEFLSWNYNEIEFNCLWNCFKMCEKSKKYSNLTIIFPLIFPIPCFVHRFTMKYSADWQFDSVGWKLSNSMVSHELSETENRHYKGMDLFQMPIQKIQCCCRSAKYPQSFKLIHLFVLRLWCH